MFGHFWIFPDTPLIPRMFLSFPGFSGFARCFPLRTTRLTSVPFHLPVISGFFCFGFAILHVFPLKVLSWLRFSAVLRFFFSASRFFHFDPVISQLFSFMFLSFSNFYDFLRLMPAISQVLLFMLLTCSWHFRMFPHFASFSGFVRP